MRNFINALLNEARVEDELFGSIWKITSADPNLKNNKEIANDLSYIQKIVAQIKAMPRRDVKVWVARAARYFFAEGIVNEGCDNEQLLKLCQKIVAQYNSGITASGTAAEVWVPLGEFSNWVRTTLVGHFLPLDFHQAQDYRFDQQSVAQAKRDIAEIDRAFAQYQSTFLEKEPGDKIIMTFPDGMVWMLLSRGYCSAEAKAMGHCGNVGAADGSRIVSLRKPKVGKDGVERYQPCLTFILNRDGTLGETKGRGNDKPAAHYHSYIVALLKSRYIKGITGGGYKPENNFSINDLPDDLQNDLVDQKPGLETGSFAGSSSDKLVVQVSETLAWFDVPDGSRRTLDMKSLENSHAYLNSTDNVYSLRKIRIRRDGTKAYKSVAVVTINDEVLTRIYIQHGSYRDALPDNLYPAMAALLENIPTLKQISMSRDIFNLLQLGRETLLRVFKQQPNLVGSVGRYPRTLDDIKAIPEEISHSRPFLDNLITNNIMGNQIGKSWNQEDLIQVIAYYVNIFPEEKLWEHFCDLYPKLLNFLPDDLKTDAVKIATASSCDSFHGIEVFVPKPWPKPVDDKFWQSKVRRTSIGISELPEDQRTPSNLSWAIGNDPDEMENYTNLLTPAIIEQGLEHILTNENGTKRFIAGLPVQFRTKDLQKMIYGRAMGLKNKSQAGERDTYLEALSMFPQTLWPWKASALSNRMATVNPDFMANPEQFHSLHSAVSWVAYHPFGLKTLPKEFVDQKVVDAAINHSEGFADRSDKGPFIRDVLENCDPHIVRPEWVNEALKTWRDLSQVWTYIPVDYLSREMINMLLAKGAIPFDDPRFPKDAFTPENITARFNVGVPYSKVERIEKRKNGKVISSGDEIVENVAGMKAAWDSLPTSIDRKKTLIALVTSKGGKSASLSNVYGRRNNDRGAGFAPLLTVVDKSLLDADVLTAWLRHTSAYAHYNKDIFQAFPKTSYTAENMAIAVEKHVIDKVPSNLQDDSVLVKMLKNWSSDAKNVNWKKITPEVMLKLGKESASDLAMNLKFNVPENSPLFTNRDIALELLLKKKGERSYLSSAAKDKDLYSIYGEHPERTRNWDQRCYDLAAGNIVPVSHIPEKFRSDKVYERALMTDPASVVDIPHPAKFLNDTGVKIPSIATNMLTGHGVVNTPDGWVDFRDKPHIKVKGSPGSYVVTDLKPKGMALIIFDDEDKPVDALIGGAQGLGDTWSPKMFASSLEIPTDDYSYSSRDHNPLKNLSKYRLLISDAISKNEDLSTVLPDMKVDELQGINLFRKGLEVLPVEKMPRRALMNTHVMYVTPQYQRGHRYNGGTKSYLFEGESGPLLAIVATDSSGRGISVTAAAIQQHKMPLLLTASKGFAQFLYEEDVLSGNNPTFKETDWYKKLGVRGPGKGEWYSLLDEKLVSEGHLSVWRYKDRYSIAHDEQGLLATAKKTKAGFNVEYRSEAEADFNSEVTALFQAIEKRL